MGNSSAGWNRHAATGEHRGARACECIPASDGEWFNLQWKLQAAASQELEAEGLSCSSWPKQGPHPPFTHLPLCSGSAPAAPLCASPDSRHLSSSSACPVGSGHTTQPSGASLSACCLPRSGPSLVNEVAHGLAVPCLSAGEAQRGESSPKEGEWRWEPRSRSSVGKASASISAALVRVGKMVLKTVGATEESRAWGGQRGKTPSYTPGEGFLGPS